MKIPYVKKVATKLNTFKIDNLHQAIKNSFNIGVSDNGYIIHYKQNKLPISTTWDWITNMSRVGNTLFYLTETFNLYYQRISGEMAMLPNTYNEHPICVQIEEKGQEKILILDGFGNACVLDKEGQVRECTVVSGKVACVYNRMLFIATGNSIYFSTVGDYTDFTLDLRRGGIVKTDINDGDVLGLVVNNDKLVVFTQKAIYELTAKGERIDYTLKRIMQANFDNVIKSSIKSCSGHVVYIDKKTLCTYKDGNIKKISSYLDDDKVNITNSFGVKDGVYFATTQGSIYSTAIFGYDFKTKTQSFIGCIYPLVCDGGNTIDNMGNIYSIEQTTDIDGTWKMSTYKFNFDTAKDKVLHKISMFCKGNCQMIVESDCGKRVFLLKDGANVKRMNIPSASFSLTFSGDKHFFMNEIKIEYRVKENY